MHARVHNVISFGLSTFHGAIITKRSQVSASSSILIILIFIFKLHFINNPINNIKWHKTMFFELLYITPWAL